MKRTLALVLAVTMMFTNAVTAFAADAVAKYPVDDISSHGYLIDEDDNGVDLTEDVDMIPYGETVYFPLLNGVGGTSYDTTAVSDITSAYNTYTTAKSSIDSDALAAAKADKESYYATAASTKEDSTKKAEYTKVKSVFGTTPSVVDNDHTNFTTASTTEKITKSTDKYTAGGALNNWERSDIAALAARSDEAAYCGGGSSVNESAWQLCQDIQDLSSGDFDTGDPRLYNGGDSRFSSLTYYDYVEHCSHDVSDYTTTTSGDAGKQAEWNAAHAKSASEWNSLTTGFNCEEETTYNYKDSDPCTATGLTGKTRSQIKSIITQGTDYYTEIISAGTDSAKLAKYNAAKSFLSGAYKTWESKVKAFNSKYSTSYDVDTALSKFTSTIKDKTTTSAFKYVYEKEAAGNMKVTADWEEGKSFVEDVSIVRKKISADSYSVAGASSDSSKRYLYFLAIEIKDKGTTSSNELYGEITIKQSGSKSYAEVEKLTFDVNMELGYDYAGDSSDGEIPTTPKTFKSGDGFESDSEFEFTFEADSDSFFVVNTNGQGRIVLGFDTDYDDDIGNKYPDAELYFFNGNYATFNRMGTLYLASDDDDLYVYAIDEDGDLSKVDAEYDDSEEAYVIKTRTLGRYVLSDEKLSTKSSSSRDEYEYNESSSGNSGSSGTVNVPTTTPTPTPSTTPNYTPPANTTPVTPAAPPAASSKVEEPKQEDKKDEEEEEEEEEDLDIEIIEDEDELEEDEDVVDVVVDDEENEAPKKKKGLSGLAWTLIIAGLAGVPVVIGVVYYIQNRPTKREFFDEDEEYDDDDDE